MSKMCMRCYKIKEDTNPSGFCQQCYHLEMNEYETIKQYVHAHPRCSILDLVQNTGIQKTVIERMISYGGIEWSG